MFTYFQEEVKTSQYCKSYAQVVATGGRCLQQQVSSQPCEVIVICDNDMQQDVVGPSTSNAEIQQIRNLSHLRGGAGGAPNMIDLCIRSAYRMGIFLQQGTPNPAAGNCLFESAIYNINDRLEFRPYTLENLSVQECRALWVTLLQTQIPVYRPEFDAYSDDDWRAMARDGTWDENLGDLMPYAISIGTHKRMIIWHTNSGAGRLVSIVEPETFGVDSDSEIPICLAYSGSHYESMHPLNVEETVKLFESIKNGTSPYLNSNNTESMLAPFSNAEKCKRSKTLKKMNIEVTPKKTMSSSEKRQRDTEYRRQYRKDNPDKRQTERQKNTDHMKDYRQDNPDKVREKDTEYRRQYRQDNPDKRQRERQKDSKYRQTKRHQTLIQQIDSDTSFESIC